MHQTSKKGETTGAAIFASYSFLPNKINKKTSMSCGETIELARKSRSIIHWLAVKMKTNEF